MNSRNSPHSVKTPPDTDPLARAHEEIARLTKINEALIGYVERSTDRQGNAYTLFQTAINLEGQVTRRTEELTNTLTSLEQSNRELQSAKDAAEKADLSKTRFLAAASHDLLQPVNAASLLLSSLAELQNSEESRALVQQVGRSLNTIDELLRALLDISRLDAGVVLPRIENIELMELFESLASDFKPLAAQRQIELRIRQTDIHVMSDRTMLRRVVQNILSNAIRYTDKGGVLLAARRRGKTTRIDIVDTGIGISDELNTEIFEEFHRGIPPGRYEDDISGGLGLGLTIVDRMLRTLDHQMKFRSRLDRGTWFQLRLPTSIKQKSGLVNSDRSAGISRLQGVHGTRILLVENDIAVLQAMEDLLERWHCDTRSATNSGEALEQLEHQSTGQQHWEPQVIIADQQLDQGDIGTHTIEQARQRIGKTTPAILITADRSDSVTETASRIGIELMHKPVKPAQLRALLTHVLS